MTRPPARIAVAAAIAIGVAIAGDVEVELPEVEGVEAGTRNVTALRWRAARAGEMGGALDPAGAARDHKAGVAKLRRGGYAEAVEILQRALEKNPASPAITTDLAYALARTGEIDEAERLYRRAISLDSRRIYAYVNLADLVARAPDRWHRRAEIVALLGKGMAALGDDPRASMQLRLALADFERRVGRLADARRALEPASAAEIPAALRKRALDLGAAIAADEATQALDDWPEPPLPPGADAALQRAEALLAAGKVKPALDAVEPVLAAEPTASAARFLRARALEVLGRYDEAASELALLLQVRPSHARAWRLLGIILARHGGGLEAERAEEALRRALALEPSWDDLRALRRLVAEKRRTGGPRRAAVAAPPPSRRALSLVEEAERWMVLDTPEMAEAALREAIKDSPAFVDAAVSLFALAREIPPEVPQALWDDGDALARLSAQLLGLRKDTAVVELVAPWLERAVAVGSSAARFERALLRANAGDRSGALADLVAYAAADVNPPRLSEARALRASLVAPGEGRRSPRQLARLHLLADRPADAERALGGPCRAGIDAATLVELGRVREYAGEPSEALACYRLGLAAGGAAAPVSRQRLARLAARIGPGQAAAVESDLVAARRAGVPEAALALAELGRSRDEADEALAGYAEFLARADADDPLRPEAETQAGRLRAREAALRRARAERRRLVTAGGAAAVLLLLGAGGALVLHRRFRGAPVERALRVHPALFPEVVRAAAEIRHDVLKHRASALGLVAAGGPREEVARALCEPTPASAAVAEAYDRLRAGAAALGVTLRRLDREPVFGPLVRDLARAEALVSVPSGARYGDRELAELTALDDALRERHPASLARLTTAGPRTRLDPAEVSSWIRAVEAEHRARGSDGADWTAPELHLQEIDIELPVTEPVLATVLANLLRNAAAAVRGQSRPRIVVRVGEERDATGRRLATLLVADSAERTVTAEEIAGRAADRGLGIVRELVRRWGGHLVVRTQEPPLSKAIGAVFPVVTPQAPEVAP